MAGKADFADDPRAFRPRLHAGKGNAGIHDMALDAMEPPEKIEVPPGAAKLPIRDSLKPDLLLLLYDPLNLAVLERLEICSADLALRAFLTRRLQRRRAQQTADVISAERRLGTLHDPHLFAIPTLPRGVRSQSRRSQNA